MKPRHHSSVLCSFILSALLGKVWAQPQPCGGAAFARVGSKFYIQGGATSGDHLLASLWALDLSTSWTTSKPAWTSLALGPFNAYHSAGYTSDNTSFITFGRDTAADPQVIPDSWVNVYDIASNSWTFSSNPANMADNSRRDFSVVTNPSANQIYILGGDAGPAGAIWSNMFNVYDPMSRTLTETVTPEPGPQSISTYAAVWVPRMNAMLVIGGATPKGSPQRIYVYHPDTGAWTTQATTGSFTYARISHCAASNADGSIVAVFGGFISGVGSGDPYVYLLDTRTWTWTTTPYPGRGRGNAACTIVDDTFIIWGGFYNNPNNINGVPLGAEALLLFQLSTKSWITTYTPSSAMAGSGAGGGGGGSGSNDPNKMNGSSSGMSSAVIGGIAAGVVAILLVTVFTVYDRVRRSKKREKEEQEMEGQGPDGDDHGVEGFGQDRFGYQHPNHSDSPVPHRPLPTASKTAPPGRMYPVMTPTGEPVHPHENQQGAEGYSGSVGYSDPSTPTTLQFLTTSEPGNAHGDSRYLSGISGVSGISGRQSYLSDGSVYYSPPPPPQRQSPPLSMSNSGSVVDGSYQYLQPGAKQDGRRPNDPHTIDAPLRGYDSRGLGSNASNFYPPNEGFQNRSNVHVPASDYHDSSRTTQSGHWDMLSTGSNPQGYEGYVDGTGMWASGAGSVVPPVVPKRPVSNPQGGMGEFGSVVHQPMPGAPHAILQHPPGSPVNWQP
ncbi:hypothetical protein BGZ94_002530 [Podila epigama]|nr:hypothetical protein BGZ94_002530 [Podila epigama]